jgi:glyoxylase-like metal-dependent hydrolase (beta-lactamase superfamily II)
VNHCNPDAPPTIGGNLRRAVDEIAAANGVINRVTHMVYSHHHADHSDAASLFDGDVVRIGHEETAGCCCATTTRPGRSQR